MKKIFILLLLIFLPLLGQSQNKIPIGIMQYKGGDWYAVTRAAKNFVQEAQRISPLSLELIPKVDLKDRRLLFSVPILILNGHGESGYASIILDEVERNNLKQYLDHGGFLLINDDYGLDASVRKLLADLYPDQELMELSGDFPLFNTYFSFSSLPKVHKHEGLPPKAYGLFIDKRLAILYLFSSDITDGWEPEGVYPEDSKEIREKAIQFGVNILYYVLSN